MENVFAALVSKFLSHHLTSDRSGIGRCIPLGALLGSIWHLPTKSSAPFYEELGLWHFLHLPLPGCLNLRITNPPIPTALPQLFSLWPSWCWHHPVSSLGFEFAESFSAQGQAQTLACHIPLLLVLGHIIKSSVPLVPHSSNIEDKAPISKTCCCKYQTY